MCTARQCKNVPYFLFFFLCDLVFSRSKIKIEILFIRKNEKYYTHKAINRLSVYQFISQSNQKMSTTTITKYPRQERTRMSSFEANQLRSKEMRTRLIHMKRERANAITYMPTTITYMPTTYAPTTYAHAYGIVFSLPIRRMEHANDAAAADRDFAKKEVLRGGRIIDLNQLMMDLLPSSSEDIDSELYFTKNTKTRNAFNGRQQKRCAGKLELTKNIAQAVTKTAKIVSSCIGISTIIDAGEDDDVVVSAPIKKNKYIPSKHEMQLSTAKLAAKRDYKIHQGCDCICSRAVLKIVGACNCS